MKLNYSLSMWNYEAYTRPKTLEEAVAEARRSGYGVEVWPSWKDDINLFAPKNRERLVRMLQDVSSSLHGGGDVVTIKQHMTQIDAAYDTKSPVIVVHSDSLGLVEHGADDYGLARDVVAYAKEKGVTIALENGTGSARLDKLTSALEAVDDLRICLDIGHVYVMHDHPIREYLSRLGTRIAHLHLQDIYMVPGTRRAKGDSHRTPGQCDIPIADWQLFISTLKKINFNGFAVFEVRPFTPDEIAGQAVEFIESIGS